MEEVKILKDFLEELTDTDWMYIVSDVLSLEDAIKNYLKTI